VCTFPIASFLGIVVGNPPIIQATDTLSVAPFFKNRTFKEQNRKAHRAMGPKPSSPSPSSAPTAGAPSSTTAWLKNLCWFGMFACQAALVYGLVFAHSSSYLFSFSANGPVLGVVDPAQLQQLRGYPGQQQGNAVWAYSPLAIPPGSPPNLPRIEAEPETDATRGIYGGRGDGKHLGGFTEFDPHGVAPGVWAKMITEIGVKSIMDVGCGRGTSSRWFLEHKARVLCVEGSHDAVTKSFLPPDAIVEHDYSRGPWWPQDTYDAAWSVEFLEHVSRQYMHNYIQTLRKAAVLFVTSSRWGGWHHVEVHGDEWWIRKFTSYGFVYDAALTQTVRDWALGDKDGAYLLPAGDKPQPRHVVMSMKVFINPAVASLPAHAHLFAEDGCLGGALPREAWAGTGKRRHEPRRCGTGKNGVMETPLGDSMLPLEIDMSMHERWIEKIRSGITLPKEGGEEEGGAGEAAAAAAAVTRDA
jgi:SAM-dependent methyltransferase